VIIKSADDAKDNNSGTKMVEENSASRNAFPRCFLLVHGVVSVYVIVSELDCRRGSHNHFASGEPIRKGCGME
jgi:hypothetical protein